MTTIILKPFLHKQQECIGIHCSKMAPLNNAIKKIAGSRWTKTFKCWYVPLSRAYYTAILNAMEGLGTTDHTALKTYLTEKKKQTAAAIGTIGGQTNIVINSNTLNQAGTQKAIPAALTKTPAIHPVNLPVLAATRERIILKAYSPSTLTTYLNEISQLLQTIGKTSADSLTTEQLKRYFVYCFEKLKLSENTLHSRINAIKFYYEQVLGREKFFWDIPRPKKHDQLPKVFSQDDIAAIINSVKNKKHKAMLMLAYSGGLRVNEVAKIKTTDIDSKRMVIFIERAKGKKDRLVTLSPVLLVMLREYALEYKPARTGFLFEGTKPNQPYSTRSLQEVIQAAKKKAGIIQPGSMHSLRHSFATHLIEKGTDVTMIQKLLGHNDIRTTMRYLHTSNRDLLKIISPLDNLNLTYRGFALLQKTVFFL